MSAGGLALVSSVMAALTTHAREGRLHPLPLIVSGLLVCVALAADCRSRALLQAGRSRRTDHRLRAARLLSALAGMLSAVLLVDMFQNRPGHPEVAGTARDLVGITQDHALLADGWHGELLADGLLVTINSHAPITGAARRFNRSLTRPVAYATVTIMNMSQPEPVAIGTITARALLADGQIVDALTSSELAARGAAMTNTAGNRPDLQRPLPLGALAADIPLCLEHDFRWVDVVGIELRFGSRLLVVAGQFLTAQEKNDLLRAQPAGSRACGEKRTAEEWFKNL